MISESESESVSIQTIETVKGVYRYISSSKYGSVVITSLIVYIERQ